MSLLKTLAKVAIGVAVAKGVGGMIRKAGAEAPTRGPGGGGTFGGPNSPGAGGGLEDMMGEILGGKRSTQAAGSDDRSVVGGSGSLGGLMEELGQYAPGRAGGSAPRGTTGGGLGDIIGGLAKGQQSGAGGGLGDLLGGLLGGLAGAAAGGGGSGGSFGDIFNQSLSNRGEPEVTPTADQNAAAGLLLRAMIQAAKADGEVDEAEQKKLLGNLGDVSADERKFVEAELRRPIDVDGLVREVPRGLEGQVYMMSVMAIDLDNRSEAEYLHALATKLGIDRQQVNHIHQRLGVPALYT